GRASSTDATPLVFLRDRIEGRDRMQWPAQRRRLHLLPEAGELLFERRRKGSDSERMAVAPTGVAGAHVRDALGVDHPVLGGVGGRAPASTSARWRAPRRATASPSAPTSPTSAAWAIARGS